MKCDLSSFVRCLCALIAKSGTIQLSALLSVREIYPMHISQETLLIRTPDRTSLKSDMVLNNHRAPLLLKIEGCHAFDPESSLQVAALGSSYPSRSDILFH